MGAEAGGGAGAGANAGAAEASALLPALLLTGARLADGRTVDVRLWGERIEAVGAVGSLSAPERLDLRGYLLLPAPAEPHAHLDEAFTGEGGAEAGAGGDELRRRITEAALTYLGYGATALRTQILVSEETGLARLDAALQAARDLRGLVDCQITVLPGRFPDAASTPESERRALALLRDGLRAGAHALGGRLAEAPDPPARLAALVALAREHDRPLDLHGTAGLASAESDGAAELPPGSVLCADGSASPAPASDALSVASSAPASVSALARSGAGVVVLPAAGRCTGGLPRSVSGFDPAAVRALVAAGVPVAAGSGALRDAVCPVGRADPLETAFLLSAATGLPATEAYAAVSSTARAMLGLTPGQIRAGDPAELVAVRGERLTAALSGGHSRVVIHRGRVVSRTSAVREYADTTAAAVPRQGRPAPT